MVIKLQAFRIEPPLLTAILGITSILPYWVELSHPRKRKAIVLLVIWLITSLFGLEVEATTLPKVLTWLVLPIVSIDTCVRVIQPAEALDSA
jgi:hypothetical protein